jgi:hypothetical protein
VFLRLIKQWESVESEIADFEDDEHLKLTARLLGFQRTPGDPNGRRRYSTAIQGYRELRASSTDQDKALALIDVYSTS